MLFFLIPPVLAHRAGSNVPARCTSFSLTGGGFYGGASLPIDGVISSCDSNNRIYRHHGDARCSVFNTGSKTEKRGRIWGMSGYGTEPTPQTNAPGEHVTLTPTERMQRGVGTAVRETLETMGPRWYRATRRGITGCMHRGGSRLAGWSGTALENARPVVIPCFGIGEPFRGQRLRTWQASHESLINVTESRYAEMRSPYRLSAAFRRLLELWHHPPVCRFVGAEPTSVTMVISIGIDAFSFPLKELKDSLAACRSKDGTSMWAPVRLEWPVVPRPGETGTSAVGSQTAVFRIDLRRHEGEADTVRFLDPAADDLTVPDHDGHPRTISKAKLIRHDCRPQWDELGLTYVDDVRERSKLLVERDLTVTPEEGGGGMSATVALLVVSVCVRIHAQASQPGPPLGGSGGVARRPDRLGDRLPRRMDAVRPPVPAERRARGAAHEFPTGPVAQRHTELHRSSGARGTARPDATRPDALAHPRIRGTGRRRLRRGCGHHTTAVRPAMDGV